MFDNPNVDDHHHAKLECVWDDRLGCFVAFTAGQLGKSSAELEENRALARKNGDALKEKYQKSPSIEGLFSLSVWP